MYLGLLLINYSLYVWVKLERYVMQQIIFQNFNERIEVKFGYATTNFFKIYEYKCLIYSLPIYKRHLVKDKISAIITPEHLVKLVEIKCLLFIVEYLCLSKVGPD